MDSETVEVFSFPCRFPIKVFGEHADDFTALVLEIIEPHVGPLSAEAIASRPSRGGRYIAVTITIDAQSRSQLDGVYRALSSHERIMMAL